MVLMKKLWRLLLYHKISDDVCYCGYARVWYLVEKTAMWLHLGSLAAQILAVISHVLLADHYHLNPITQTAVVGRNGLQMLFGAGMLWAQRLKFRHQAIQRHWWSHLDRF